MTASIVEVIQHYQRSIDNSQDNEARLLYCIQKLYKLPIKVEHLQETGVGKTVNSLRKFNGEIGVAAKSLVTKWKAMVAAEEEPMDTTPQSYDNETQDNDNDDHDQSPHNDVDEEDDENQNHHNTATTQQSKQSGHSEKEKHKERSHSSSSGSITHKETSSKQPASSSASSSSKHSNDKHKSSSTSSSRDKEGHHKSSSSSSKEREREKTEHKSRDKHKDKDQEKERERSEKRRDEKHKSEKEVKSDSSNHKNSSSSKSQSEDKHNHQSTSKDKTDKEQERSDKHKSSSKDKEKSKEEKSSSSSKDKHDRKSSSSSSSHKSSSSAKDSSETSERKKRHNSDTESSDFKSPQPKVAKVQKSSTSAKSVEFSSPPQEEDSEDCFDSSMGTNFGDILGMLNVPSKKGKKSAKSSSTSSGGSLKDTPPKPSTSHRTTPIKVNGVNSSPVIYAPMSSMKLPTAKPDLLAPTAKLEPLDPSIVLELPTISTNYKPMPLNQTVMDCVFNTTSSSSKPVRTLTDAEALHHGISSKTMRTKIYSGTRTGQIFQVSSLFDMCIRILQKNIDALEYTGGVPFEVLRPVLERATPQQLFTFEDYNSYVMEDSDVLWQFHVSRNYRTQKRLENESWREMFLRCQEEEERRLSILKNSIKASQKIAAAPVRKTQLAFIDSMVKPPRNVIRKQEQYGTKSKLVATPAARVVSLQNATPNAAKTGDQRLKVAATMRDHAQVSSSVARNKKAPLMQKTLAFIRGRLKR